MEMQIVGISTGQEFWVASDIKKFKIKQLLIVEDHEHGNKIGEVIEAISYNPRVSFSISSTLINDDVVKSLENSGFDSENYTFLAKVKLLYESEFAIEASSNVREARFDEIKDLMMPKDLSNAILLGAIRGTEDLYEQINEKYKDVLTLLRNGEVKKQNLIPFYFGFNKLSQYPHIGIFGGSGSGKSFLIRVMLEELMKKSIPVIVFDQHFEASFDSANNNYYSSKFKRVTIGQDVGIKFSELLTEDLETLLDSVKKMPDSMAYSVEALHKNNDTIKGFYDRVSMLAEGIEMGEKRVDMIAQSSSAKAERCAKILELMHFYQGQVDFNAIKGILWRFRTLQEEGIFYNDLSQIINTIRNKMVVVIQGDPRVLQVFTNYVLNKIYKMRRNFKDSETKTEQSPYFPPFVVVADEAHNLMPRTEDTPTKGIFKEIAQEGRKYNIFLIVGTQRPSILDETITAQLNTNFIFRLVKEVDIKTIGEETDLTREETRRLPYLESGDAFVSSAILGRTLSIRIRNKETESTKTADIFDELAKEESRNIDAMSKLLLRYIPIYKDEIGETVKKIFTDTGKTFSAMLIIAKLESMAAEGEISKYRTEKGIKYDK